jgi:hypothetical protein
MYTGVMTPGTHTLSLSLSLSLTHTHLYERQLAWAKRRDEQMEEERQEIQRERERECTFQPKINTIPESSDYALSHRCIYTYDLATTPAFTGLCVRE